MTGPSTCAQCKNREVVEVAKRGKVYFLTAYVEYLWEEGIRSEETYLGDASRYVRWLLQQATEQDMHRYIEERARTASYRSRLRRNVGKFVEFARRRLGGSPSTAPENVSFRSGGRR